MNLADAVLKAPRLDLRAVYRQAFFEGMATVEYSRKNKCQIWSITSHCSTVQDLHVDQIRSLVRNMEREIRDIFEGKVMWQYFSWVLYQASRYCELVALFIILYSCRFQSLESNCFMRWQTRLYPLPPFSNTSVLKYHSVFGWSWIVFPFLHFAKRARHKNGGASLLCFHSFSFPLFRRFVCYIFGGRSVPIAVAFFNHAVFGVCIKTRHFQSFPPLSHCTLYNISSFSIVLNRNTIPKLRHCTPFSHENGVMET